MATTSLSQAPGADPYQEEAGAASDQEAAVLRAAPLSTPTDASERGGWRQLTLEQATAVAANREQPGELEADGAPEQSAQRSRGPEGQVAGEGTSTTLGVALIAAGGLFLVSAITSFWMQRRRRAS
jgi:hypothetical protein